MSVAAVASLQPEVGQELRLHYPAEGYRCTVAVVSVAPDAIDVRMLAEDEELEGVGQEWSLYASELERGAVTVEVVG